MKVLNAFEESGVVRRAFRALGHDAWSCDLLPARDSSPHHFQCDVRELLTERWDLIIAHPPCDYLANSGVQWLTNTPANPRPGVLYGTARWAALHEGAELFRLLFTANTAHLTIENPVPHKYARELIGVPYTQIIQPYEFGHQQTKKTCLWLWNLPKLVPTKIMPPPYEPTCHHEPPGPLRKLRRSETYAGIAAAMADQWGCL